MRIQVTDAELSWMVEDTIHNTPDQGVTLGPDYQAPDWRPLLPSLDSPVMIITGKQSGAYPGCVYMAEHIPNAHLVMCENSGHAPSVSNAYRSFSFNLKNSRWTTLPSLTRAEPTGYRDGHRIRDAMSLRKNAYRVLLLRGRDCCTVFIPPIPVKTRDTYAYLRDCGFTELKD